MKIVTIQYLLNNEPRKVSLTCSNDPEEMKKDYIKALKEMHPDGDYVIQEVTYSAFNIEENLQ